MKFAMYGSGAAGSVFASYLRNGGADIILIDRYEAHMKKIAEAFDICGMEITDENDLSKTVKAVFDHEGPVICRVKTDIMQKVLPKQSNFMNEKGQMESRPLEDMTPLLDREELRDCMEWGET